jgi:hypothetical protein
MIALIQTVDISAIEAAIIKMTDSIWLDLGVVLLAVGMISKDIRYLRKIPLKEVESFYDLKFAEQDGGGQPATRPESK